MLVARFKGGPIFLNSGGRGPNDYLIKPIKGGRWARVIRRGGRHWQRDKPQLEAAADAENDNYAWSYIVPMQQICIPDNAQRAASLKAVGKLVTMSATEFWEKYKDKPEFVVDHYGRIVREV